MLKADPGRGRFARKRAMLTGVRRCHMVEKPRLVGRERELDELVRFLDAVPTGPVGLLFEGDAGIGKTTLWREAVLEALDRRSACSPADRSSRRGSSPSPRLATCSRRFPIRRPPSCPFRSAGLSRSHSCKSMPRDRLRFREQSRSASSACSERSPPQTPRNRSRRPPVARPTVGEHPGVRRQAPAWRADRLRPPRRGAKADAPLALDQTLPPEALRRLLIGPLDGDSLGRLIRSRFDIHLRPPALRQLEAASGGNPYFAIELARSLAERDIPLGPGEPLPVPGTLRALLGLRLADLAPETHTVTLAASALARPTVALVEASVRSVDPPAALAAAVDAGLLELDHDRVRFAHPLIASVVYADADAAERRALHALIAEVVEEPEERARHLALATDAPDEDVAASLDEAARSVRARGAPGEAAELYEEARRLTPPLQTNDAARRPSTLPNATSRGRLRPCPHVAGGGHGGYAQHRAGACARVPRLGAGEPGGAWRRRRHFPRGARGGRSRHSAAHRDRARPRGPFTSWAISRPPRSTLGQLLEMAERLREPSLLARAVSDMAFFEAVTGRGDPLSRIESALEHDEPVEWRAIYDRPRWIHAMILVWRDELDSAGTVLDEMHRAALDYGDEHSLPYILFYLARIEMLRGRFESASAYERAYEAAVETGQESEQPFALTIMALVDAHLGRVEPAREATDEGMSLALRLEVVPAYLGLRAARGFLELSLASYEEAHRFLGTLHEDVAKAGLGEPALYRFHGDAIETLVALGKLEEAASLLSEFEESGEALRQPWARAIAARCRGLLSAAGGDLPAAFLPSSARSSCMRASVSRSSWRERTWSWERSVGAAGRRGQLAIRCRLRSTPSSRSVHRSGPSVPAPSWRGSEGAPSPRMLLRRPSSVSRSSSRPAVPIERSPTPSSSARRRCNGTCRRSTGSSASARARSSRRASLPPTVTSQPQPNRRLHGSPAHGRPA